ncbi:MAG: hypothetical protein K6G60_08395 [Lachnospiraceae bacterium]|nr:hypothetical protein [Lachnospiraceae bacterium]
MLVKVSKKYCGTFGIFNEGTGSVIKKDNTSAPFEMDDALAASHIKNGILVTADDEEEPVSDAAPEAFEEDPEDFEESEEMSEEIPSEVPEGIPEELPADEEDLDSITDYKVLKELAKEAGVNPVGKNKEELRKAIREARA